MADVLAGEWVTGGRWDHEAWPGQRRPNRQLVDRAAPENPVLLSRLDGHIAVANTLALERAGVGRDTPDPRGGHIERDPDTGEPTGILIDAAQGLVRREIPEPSDEQRARAADAAIRHAASLGVTSVHAMGPPDELRLLRRLEEEGRLHVRARVALPDVGAAVEESRAGAAGGSLVRTGAVKLFADGSLGAGSALLFEPYDDQPTSSGLAIYEEEELRSLVAEADAAGLQIAMHAIGDRATRMALDAFQYAAERNGRRGARHRVEHAQVVQPEDRARFARVGVIASVQPSHCTDDMRWVGKRLGARTRFAYPYRSLVDAGARVALGTDWPVEALDPLISIHAAVTRQSPAGEPDGGWHPEERVSLAEAVRDYTLGSAFAEFQEQNKGSIEAGKLADMVILSRDLFAIPPEEIPGVQVEMTILGGRVVYERAVSGSR